eukprot:scaffold29783_cov42-Phaeocystis_antarctica.AAC.3
MNAMLKLTVKCLKCCLWCFEKTVRYTYYGYTYYGYTYYGCLWCFEKTARLVTLQALTIPHTPHHAAHPNHATHPYHTAHP